LATFATFEAIRQVWIRFDNPFGGHEGLHNIPTFGEVPNYYLVLGLTALSVVIMHRLEYSRVGDAIKSIASEEFLGESVGIHIWSYRALAFAIGGFFVGLAGALFAHTTGTVTPTDFTFFTMLTILVAAIVGGTTTIFGPMIGICLITAVEYFGVRLLDWLPLVFGCIPIAVMLFLPGGLESIPGRISAWRQGRSPNR
jgi:branched-chain amino acid transport system permease protein